MSTALNDELADCTEVERAAFNAAFYELGLRLYWDKRTYQTLAANPNERERVRVYLEREQPHLLRAYDAEFLADAVIAAKHRCRKSLFNRAASVLPEPACTERPWEEIGF